MGGASRSERGLELLDQVQGILDFLLVKRRVICVCGRIEYTLGAGENFVDQYDLAEALNVVLRDKSAKTFAVGLETALGRLVECRVAVDIIV